jgi:FAD/FMN-containing dehydrogenase
VAVLAARAGTLPLSVKGGGHDWAGRALCDGIVVDLSEMRKVTVSADATSVRVGGGALASDLATQLDPRGLVAVTGSVGAVGMGGLTLGGGYGPLIARFGLASDNLIGAEVVLADGRVVVAGPSGDQELLWALQGGGGNFGVVTSMSLRLHQVPSVHCGTIIHPLSEALPVIEGVQAFCHSAPDGLTVQVALVSAPDGRPVLGIVPTWSGDPDEGEHRVASLMSLGKPIRSDVKRRSLSEALAMLDGPMMDTHNVIMDNRCSAQLTREIAEVLVEQTVKRPGPGCSIVTHEFRGCAARVPMEATAFGMRSEHIMMEIIAQYDEGDGSAERAWVDRTARRLDPLSFAGAYPNLLAPGNPRAGASYGPNSARLAAAKRRYDPSNFFRHTTDLPG